MLETGDKAAVREAQIRLAMAGTRALSALAKLRIGSQPELRARVKWILNFGLLASFPLVELRRYPGLLDLASGEIEQGHRLAEHEVAKGILAIMYIAPELWDLGGFAVPAALRLCRDPRPVARAYGACILDGVYAVAAIDSLSPLLGDRRSFPWLIEDDVVGQHGIVGDYAARVRANLTKYVSVRGVLTDPLLVMRVADKTLRHNYRIGCCLGPRFAGVTTWDEWWDRIRPEWRRWWESEPRGK
jgi:hypothetical protein